MAGALHGITVLDLTQQLPGPYTTLLLAGLGARVIKVEPPGGDAGRTIDPPMFRVVNAGKESIVLDLKSEQGRIDLHRLAVRSDVLVEGFRPGVAARLAADYATISALRPDVVYCSISGFGAAGPYVDVPGHDLNYLGVGGAVEAEPAGSWTSGAHEIGIPMVDLASGTMAALAIVAALNERAATGAGAELDVAMLDTAVFWGSVRAPLRDGGSEPAYAVVAAADGQLLSFAVIEDKFWRSLCDVLGWGDWREDPALATHHQRRQRAPEIRERLANAIATRPREAWLDVLWAADVPVAPVHERARAPSDPQIAARGLFAADASGAPVPVVPLPPSLRRRPLGPAPALGGDGERVLAELLDEVPSSGASARKRAGEQRPAESGSDRR
jgi:crotonobetainyl-CoA:carnitine CoA-transferase CaiB-like acyl-CoA transferase